MVYIASQHART